VNNSTRIRDGGSRVDSESGLTDANNIESNPEEGEISTKGNENDLDQVSFPSHVIDPRYRGGKGTIGRPWKTTLIERHSAENFGIPRDSDIETVGGPNSGTILKIDDIGGETATNLLASGRPRSREADLRNGVRIRLVLIRNQRLSRTIISAQSGLTNIPNPVARRPRRETRKRYFRWGNGITCTVDRRLRGPEPTVESQNAGARGRQLRDTGWVV
jgi:hypothetical protein